MTAFHYKHPNMNLFLLMLLAVFGSMFYIEENTGSQCQWKKRNGMHFLMFELVWTRHSTTAPCLEVKPPKKHTDQCDI